MTIFRKCTEFQKRRRNFKNVQNLYFSYEDMTSSVILISFSLWVYASKCQIWTSLSWNITSWEMIFHLLRKVGILELCAFPYSTKFILYPHGSKVQKRNLGSPVQCYALNLYNHPSLNPFWIILLTDSDGFPKPLPFPRPLPGGGRRPCCAGPPAPIGYRLSPTPR